LVLVSTSLHDRAAHVWKRYLRDDLVPAVVIGEVVTGDDRRRYEDERPVRLLEEPDRLRSRGGVVSQHDVFMFRPVDQVFHPKVADGVDNAFPAETSTRLDDAVDPSYPEPLVVLGHAGVDPDAWHGLERDDRTILDREP